MYAGHTDTYSDQLVIMPPSDKPANKKRGQLKIAKQPSQPMYDVTVKDCLNWPSDVKDSKNTAPSESIYVSLRQQRQNKEDRTQQQQQPGGGVNELRRDDGTAIEALRGWPRHRQQCDQSDQDQPPYPFADDYTPSAPEPKKQLKSSKPPSKLAKSGKSNKRVVVKEPDDVHVGDLIAQRYLHEYVEQRQAQQEKERIKKEASARTASQGRRAAKDHCDIKANKAAQLRAIALADRVDTSPMDLWKMEKFTKNARPHLSTFRTRSQSGGGGGGGGGRGGRGEVSGGHRSLALRQGSARDDDEYNYGPCTCPEQEHYYTDEMDYNNEDDYQLQSLTAAVAL